MKPMIMTYPMDRTFREDIQLDSMIGKKEHDDVDNYVMVSIIN